MSSRRRRVVAGIDHRAQRGLELGRLRGRGVGLVGLLAAADPRRDRADHPGPHAGRLERGDGEVRRRRLAVRPGDADDAPARRSGRRTTRRPRSPGPAGSRPRRAAGRPASGTGRSTIAAAAPAAAAARDVVVPVDVLPGDGHEQRARAHGARVVGDAADGDVGQAGGPIARPSSRAPRSRPSAVRRSISPRERAGLGRLGGRERGRRWSVVGHRPDAAARRGSSSAPGARSAAAG